MNRRTAIRQMTGAASALLLTTANAKPTHLTEGASNHPAAPEPKSLTVLEITPAQKELILLWLMITTRTDFSPANSNNSAASDILNGIATEYNSDAPGGNWNWNYLTPATASSVVAASIVAAPAYATVNTVFQHFGAIPWPGSGDHPRVTEIKKALGMPSPTA
jgi:hypothetical protein